MGDVKYLALGMSVSFRQHQLQDATAEILERFLADPFSDGANDKKDVLRKTGLHFVDATYQLRTDYIKAMQRLPFRGYIGFARLQHQKDYKETYLRILGAMLPRRLIAAPDSFARFCFEENGRLGKKAVAECDVRKVVEAAHQNLRTRGNRCPRVIEVAQVRKDDFGVSIPDFLLAAFRGYRMLSYQELNNSKTKQEQVLFERLRDKIRVIFDVDTGREFGRRDPL